MSKTKRLFLIAFTTLALLLNAVNSPAQKASKADIDLWREVLHNVQRELKNNYYDPTFKGMDIDARFKVADENMKNAQSLGQLVGIVAQVLLDLNDSHTAFIPPFNATRLDYGWQMQAVGNDVYVAGVKPGSDAEAKGLRAGDKVLTIDRRPLDRTKIWLANYLYYALRPQRTVTLLVEKPDKRQEEITFAAKVREGSEVTAYGDYMNRYRDAEEDWRVERHRYYEANDDVLIWKMTGFDLSEDGLADAFGKLKKRKALILDMRGNSGGYVNVLERFAGYLFDSDIKIAERRGRKKMEPMVVKSQKDKIFKGQLVVLIDGSSASAAVVFARLVQLEKRGVIIGDRSSGSVMQSRYHQLQTGIVNGIGYGLSATDADVIMGDGKSLEHVGVEPDELLLPTAEEMSQRLDPVMVRAAALVGLKLDPKKAGELFPVEWKTR
jgi:C-terminal processing protease CtpA/Prc